MVGLLGRLVLTVTCLGLAACLGASLVHLSGRWLRLPLTPAPGHSPETPVSADGSPVPAAEEPQPGVVPPVTGARDLMSWAEARARIAAAPAGPQREGWAAAWAAVLKERGAPWVEDGTTYFFYFGTAERVAVMADFNGWREEPLQRVADTRLWVLGVDLPPAAVLGYRLRVDGQSLVDPFNPTTTRALGTQFSVYLGPAARTSPDEPPAAPPPGRLIDLEVVSRHLERRVRVQVHLPPGCAEGRPCRTLYVFDGPYYLEEGRLAQVVAREMGRGHIPPLVIVAIDPGQDILLRLLELLPGLGGHGDVAAFLALELVPLVEERFPVLPGRAQRAVMGMSAGGAAALQVALSYPEVFGRVVAQSPAVVPALWESLAGFRGPPAAVYLSWGRFEENIFGLPLAQEAERLAGKLAAAGFPVRARSAPAGHTMVFWRRDAGPALRWLWQQPVK